MKINRIQVYGNELDGKLGNIYIGWEGNGFGEITFCVKNGEVIIDSECMSKDFVKQILCLLVDNATLKD